MKGLLKKVFTKKNMKLATITAIGYAVLLTTVAAVLLQEMTPVMIFVMSVSLIAGLAFFVSETIKEAEKAEKRARAKRRAERRRKLSNTANMRVSKKHVA